MTRATGLARLRDILSSRPAAMPTPTPGTKEAAVAVVVRESADPELLLIRRAERIGDPWSGHMAFPGGTRRPQDVDLLATALRETHEETGIPLSSVGALVGPLDPVVPASTRLPSIIIAPFVVTVPTQTPAMPDMREVVDAFWIPLSHLRDVRNTREFLLELELGASRRFPSVHFGEHVIWGLTHRILVQFLELAEWADL